MKLRCKKASYFWPLTANVGSKIGGRLNRSYTHAENVQTRIKPQCVVSNEMLMRNIAILHCYTVFLLC